MTVIAGLPAHVLFVHAIVVLAPLTALLEILCGVWPAARRHLIWLVVGLAVVTTVLTPLTTEAGQWLYDREQRHSTTVQTHAERGDWMIYFSVALLAVAAALVVLHWLEGRSQKRRLIANIVVAALATAMGISSVVMVVEIGDSGARAVWHDKLARADNG